MVTAIETTGKIEQNGHIVIEEKFPVDSPTEVRVIVLFPEDGEIGNGDWRSAAAKNEVFDFLNDAGADIYTLNDGMPLEK
jgi:hypothetical protein